MPLLSEIARKRKVEYFFSEVPLDARILEIGCGDQWLGRELKKRGYENYVGLDLKEPADIVGDIRNWRSLGITPGYFDVIAAFEVIEHIHCFDEMFEILRPNGKLVMTTPVPHMDWLCQIFEFCGMNQKRTSPHDSLIYLSDVELFEPVGIRTVGLMAQWGVFRRPESAPRLMPIPATGMLAFATEQK